MWCPIQLARGEKIVRSVPRSRCSLSCALSRLSRISSSLIEIGPSRRRRRDRTRAVPARASRYSPSCGGARAPGNGRDRAAHPDRGAGGAGRAASRRARAVSARVFREASGSASRSPGPLRCGPRLIVCDEPTSALDVSVQARSSTCCAAAARPGPVAAVHHAQHRCRRIPRRRGGGAQEREGRGARAGGQGTCRAGERLHA